MTIKRDINRIVDPTIIEQEKRLPARPPILSRRGRSEFKPEVATVEQPDDSVLTQCIEVYSNIILTQDGAFEMPQNWPTDGKYLLVGGFELDPDEPHYIQRRVHAAFYISGTRMIDHYYLIKIEHPYTAAYGLINTLAMPALFYGLIPLYADYTATGDELIDQIIANKLADLAALGVV